MAKQQFQLGDYVEVADRIDAFFEKYPDGSLQSEIAALTDSYVAMKAYAYRTPDDPRPGIGHSGLQIPGSTPYTKGSEMENAETSAFGRALVAVGFKTKGSKVASREEVANKQGPGQSTQAVVSRLSQWLVDNKMSWSHPAVEQAIDFKPERTTLIPQMQDWLSIDGNSEDSFIAGVVLKASKMNDEEKDDAQVAMAIDD